MAAKSLATYHSQPPDNGRERQCEAAVSKDGTRKKGERCPHSPIKGSNVCIHHGGRAGQVRESAQLRLARLVDPAINALAQELKWPVKQREIAARSQRMKAVDSVLDRNGLKGKQELDITSHQNVNLGDLSEEHLRAILALKEQLSTKASTEKPA